MTMSVDPQDFRAAMARFPGAVTIVTSSDEGAWRGITATAVCSVCAEPPSLLACVNRTTGTGAAIRKSGWFNVNLLADPSGPLALRFAGAGGVTGADKFDVGDWQADARGVPALGSALLCFSCEVSDLTQAGSHTVFIGRIVEIRPGEGDPLLYARSEFVRLAPMEG